VDKVNNFIKTAKGVKDCQVANQRLFDIVQDDLREDFFNPLIINPNEVTRISIPSMIIIENLPYLAWIIIEQVLPVINLKERDAETRLRS